MSSSFKYHIFSIYHSDPKFLEGYVLAEQALIRLIHQRGSLTRVSTVCHSVCGFLTQYPLVCPRCAEFLVTLHEAGFSCPKKKT